MCLQLKLWYDAVGHQLIVTVLGAKELPVRDDGRPQNPYVNIYFLPDRRYGPIRTQLFLNFTDLILLLIYH